jgi:hypothetical protein
MFPLIGTVFFRIKYGKQATFMLIHVAVLSFRKFLCTDLIDYWNRMSERHILDFHVSA